MFVKCLFLCLTKITIKLSTDKFVSLIKHLLMNRRISDVCNTLTLRGQIWLKTSFDHFVVILYLIVESIHMVLLFVLNFIHHRFLNSSTVIRMINVCLQARTRWWQLVSNYNFLFVYQIKTWFFGQGICFIHYSFTLIILIDIKYK